ncbi:hypothetical protein [Microcoleus sp. K4-C2]|uniref:hypothetical protein n=1 Tax=Microcoleus sp. K4-C2 TaxID=2818792 RepID=UPI002FD4FDC5
MSLVGVDKAQTAVVTYNFTVDDTVGSIFLKVNKFSLTGIGLAEVAVSEGRLNTILTLDFYGLESKEYYNLAAPTAFFYQGDFRGMQASGGDTPTRELIVPPDEPGGPY